MTLSRARRLSSERTTCHGAHARVSRLEHVVARTRIVVPAAEGLEVHRRQLPDLARVVDPRLEPAGSRLLAHLQPIFDQDDPGLDDGLLDPWASARRGTAPPASIEQNSMNPLDARRGCTSCGSHTRCCASKATVAHHRDQFGRPKRK